MRFLLLLIYSIFALQKLAHSQTPASCDSNDFKRLVVFSNKKVVKNEQFTEVLFIVNKLSNNHCRDYIIKKNGIDYEVYSLTYLFGKICCNYNNIRSVRAYMKYMQEKHGSAEEQIAFSFENIFFMNPKLILMEIAKHGEGEYLEELSWGFVNNRYYGIKDPYESDPYKAMTKYNNSPKKVLDTLNYKDIFFKINPEMKKIYGQYSKPIDHLLALIKETLTE